MGSEDGVPVVTDGPYAETQEVLAGYSIVECESFDRATEIAARLGPHAGARASAAPTVRRRPPDHRRLRRLELARASGPMTGASRTCCASWRRRSSARWCAGTAHFDTAEDAVQEALLAAAQQWPAEGVPDNPRGWLITVAARRLTDLLRSEQAGGAARTRGRGGPAARSRRRRTDRRTATTR